VRSGRTGPSSRATTRPSLATLALLLTGALLAFGAACGGSGNAQDVSTATSLPATSVPTLPPPTPTTAPLPTDPPAVDPTATPGPTSVSATGDRTSCDAIRGTDYRSASERVFFLANCIASATAPPTPASATGDRTSCEEIRDTDYRSPAEREFFLAHCVTSQPGSPTPSNPIVSPAGGATAIGDSVMLGAAPYLQANIGGLYVDATVSRQASKGAAVLQSRAQAGQLGSLVVIHLGTNGTFTAQELDGIMAQLADVPRVVIVNISVPRTWEASNNDMLAANVGRYPNARLVDWHTAALNHPEFFWDDGVHLRPAGATVYAAMIAYAAAV
jgi:lysophospholipase L1-like esterase